MNINVLKVGYFETNCYLLNKDDKYLIIDPGDNAELIIKNIKGSLEGILITHNHPDHIGALKELKKHFKLNVSDYSNLKEGKNQISIFNFDVIYNPGHTKDSISFLFNNNLFCGDFIFENNIGRTDIGGNNNEMKESIKKILKYSQDIIIYPGHGNKTTLKKEVNNLLYFKDIL